MLKLHARAVCSWGMLMLYAHGACSCCSLMLHAHAAWWYSCISCMLMLPAHATCSCRLLVLYVRAVCSSFMLLQQAAEQMVKKYAVYSCDIKKLPALAYVDKTFSCSMLILHAHGHAAYSCCTMILMLMLHAHIYAHAHVAYWRCMPMLHAHTACNVIALSTSCKL